MKIVQTTFETLVNDPMISATPELPELRGVTEGQRLHVLTELVREAKRTCTEEYKRLRSQEREATREEVNQHESLLALNAVRKNLQRERTRTASTLRRKSAARSAGFDD